MIQSTFGLDNKSICSVLRRHPNIYQLDLQKIEQQIGYFKEVFGLSREDSMGIFYDYTEAFITNKYKMLEFKNFITLTFEFKSNEELISFVKDYCFLMVIDTTNSSSVLFELTRQGISSDTILHIIRKIPFFLYGKKGNLRLVLERLNTFKLSKKEIEQLLVDNPYIVSLDYHKMMVHKIKIFQQMGIEYTDIGQIFKLFPSILTKSIFSTTAKINYLKKNFSSALRAEPYFPYILCFDFNKYIKPRGRI